jgi:2-keto-4-pentenoate hydratase/2-oxohepta-3-ene-1,7-dioic acid hydratase in catechol pathway
MDRSPGPVVERHDAIRRNPTLIDYEAELAVVIGKTARNVGRSALDYRAGHS